VGDDRRAPTIRDVARRAGVSAATVSRVLNELPLVTPDTRDRVERAIRTLGYRPSRAARSLSLGRSHAIGVVAPFFTEQSVVERLRGVVAGLEGSGYDLLLFDVEAPEQRTGVLIDFARRDRVDGLLIISLAPADEDVKTLRADRLPVVLLDLPHAALPHLAINDVAGGELATRHLLAKGHRRIGFVGDSRNPFGFTSSEHRRRGYRRALEAAGIEPVPAYERLGSHGRVEARALATELLRLDERPTAVFASSDVQAIGVLEAVAAASLSVPDDVAVIGFDDVELAEIVGLTTVRQPLHDSGELGVAILLAKIEYGDSFPVVEELAPLAVVERRTT
jgi:DNA-binding LacI/PurR family transcriptional regulator